MSTPNFFHLTKDVVIDLNRVVAVVRTDEVRNTTEKLCKIYLHDGSNTNTYQFYLSGGAFQRLQIAMGVG